jgi:hypothetical protein
MENLAINSGPGADTFNVTPATATTFFLTAGNPVPPANPGDQLVINIAGLTGATSFPNGIGAGTYNFNERGSVYYTGMESVSTTGSLLPSITSLSDSPDPVSVGSILTLTANGVAGGGQAVSSVSFYRESNGTPGLQIGSDLYLTTDSTENDGWSASILTSGLSAGTIYTFYAVATNAANIVSDPASTTTMAQPFVNQPPTIGSIGDGPDPAAIGGDVTLSVFGANDPDGNVVSVGIYRESNGIGGLQISFWAMPRGAQPTGA